MSNKFKIIAETAFSHEGDFKYLSNQVKSASNGKVDYIKFQILFDRDVFYVKEHPANNVIKNWLFDKKQWKDILFLANSLRLKVIAQPLNIPSLEFCQENEELIDLLEVHSVCFNDIHLLNELKSTKKKNNFGNRW